MTLPKDQTDFDLRAILERLNCPGENPVTRARRVVELQVPISRRGPGWERHWRELEAYLETPGAWIGSGEERGLDPAGGDE